MKIELAKPFAGSYPITQKFGVKYEYRGKLLTHFGNDWACPKRTTMLAPADGFVDRVKKHYSLWDYGKELILQHDGFKTQLGHLNEIIVEEGEDFKRGDPIGYSGRTGFVRGRTGYHLHFGLKIKDVWVDPLPFFDGGSIEVPKDVAPKKPFEIDIEDKNKLQKIFFYVVQPGDTLSGIAKNYYGDENKWQGIFHFNRKKFTNPSKIYPGQKIMLPGIKKE